jgi:hypothetical protein
MSNQHLPELKVNLRKSRLSSVTIDLNSPRFT